MSQFEFHDVPGGRYRVRAVLKGSRGEELASTSTRIDVVEDDADFDTNARRHR
jgi:hypothetical protein